MIFVLPHSAPSSCYTTQSSELDQAIAQVRDRLLDLTTNLPEQAPLLTEALKHALESQGKFLRPTITLLVGQASGLSTCSTSNVTTLQPLIEVAAVSEMIHLATLLHDDVLDEADVRRGRSTVRKQFGNTVAVLCGDFLLAQASLRLATLGNVRLVAIYAQVLADLCEGEIEQLRNRFVIPKQADLAWLAYERKSKLKTGSLFAAGCEATGVLAQLPERSISQLRLFGETLGLVFQLIDDLLDYTATQVQLGKPVMADLREGLINAPLLLALQSKPDIFTPLLQSVIGLLQQKQSVDQHTLDNQLNTLKQAVINNTALQQTQQRASELTSVALAHLSCLPHSEARQSLTNLTNSLASRSF
jgi:all-trans-nonaprenyl-diphosphate synthase